jgi:hypothetical protein
MTFLHSTLRNHVLAGAATLLLSTAAGLAAQINGMSEPDTVVTGPILVNTATPETVDPRSALVLATFRLSETVQAGSIHDLYGIDSGADVGLGVSAGLTSRWDVEAMRSSVEETFEFATKVALWRQAWGAPLSISARVGLDYLGANGAPERTRPFAEIPVSYQIGELTLFATPAYVSDTPIMKNVFNVPVGLTWQFARHWGVNGEYVPKNHDLPGGQAAWAAALALRSGRDLFKLTLQNSRATTVDEILGGDFAGGFKQGDVRLGFNFTHDFRY